MLTLFPLWLFGCAGLLAAGEPATPGGVEIPPYPGAEVFPMGGASRINTRNTRMYYFTTRADLDTVLKHYFRLWSDQGQVVTVRRMPPSGAAVGFSDLGTGRTYNVILHSQGDVLFGFPAVVEGLDAATLLAPSGPDDLPVAPEPSGLVSYESLERGGRFTTVSYANRQTVERNEGFYLREMGRRGWRLAGRQRQDGPGETLQLEFSQGPRSVHVTLAQVPGQEGCGVFLVANFAAGRAQEVQP